MNKCNKCGFKTNVIRSENHGMLCHWCAVKIINSLDDKVLRVKTSMKKFILAIDRIMKDVY